MRRRLAVIFLTVLIDLIGFGIILPILPYYARRFGAEGLEFGMLLGAFSAMQFLSTSILGRHSDRVGRRPVLLFTMGINAGGYLLFAVANSLPLLLLARIVSGFASGNISVAQAYIADVTPPEQRSKGMGLIGAAFGLGFTLGPAIGGLAAHAWGPMAPALVAAGLSSLNLVVAWRILGESLAHEHRVARDLWDFGHIRDALAHPRLRPLMLVWFIAPFAFAGYSTLVPLFAAEAYGWRERDLGFLFTIVGVVAAFVQGWAFGRIVKVTGDRALVIAGAVGMAVAIGVIPFLPSGRALYAWSVLLALSNSVFAPAISGLLSVLAGPAEQGTILGAAQSLSALGRLSGPEVFGFTMDAGGPRVAFIVTAVGMLGAAAAAHGIHRDRN
jgi:predicted MFS family arabinose efflux permease